MNPARSRPPNQRALRKPRESDIVRIYVTGAIPSAVSAALAADFELADGPEGADGILSLLTTTVDGEYIDRAGPQLRIVANYAVGVNNIDLDAARARGVLVANTPDVLTRPTAELTVTLMLSLLRRVTEGDRLIRRREPWGFSLEFMLGESLDDKLVGIVGPGRIGRETARLVEAFGARTLFVGAGDDQGALLAAADIVSLHCPLTPETHHLIDAAALAAMKPSAVLVNAARGPVVDERALVEALRSGSIAGAALDVYEHEPEVSEELLTMENVVLSPHLGSATRPTREAMGMLAVEALRAVLLRGERPANLV
jgi:glyoxylate reductase